MNNNFKILVSGISYDINFKDPEKMGGHIGLANFNSQEISINNSFTKQTQNIALIHEIIHIISDSYGLELTENQVKIGTHAFIAFLHDNPNFNIKNNF